MLFMTKYVRPEKQFDKVGGPTLTETKGYISAQTRIENLILAGRRLVEGRAEQFDMEGEIDESFNDPTRSKGFDMVDAQILADKASRALKSAMETSKSAPEDSKATGDVTSPESKKKADSVVPEQSVK